MEVNVTKVNSRGTVGVRDYLVNQAIEKHENLKIILDDQTMTIKPDDLKKGDVGNVDYQSDYSGKTYRIVYFQWKPNRSLKDIVGLGWSNVLSHTFKKDYMLGLGNWILSRRKIVEVCPKHGEVFEAFRLCDVDKVKVVILGQDPYHTIYNGVRTAHGLAFSSKTGLTPSLRSIFKELEREGIERTNSDLTDWAEQGILLLNTLLTVDQGMAFSHKEQGWEKFTLEVIGILNNHPNNLIFVLWGNAAKEYKKLISTHHYILEGVHPVAGAYGGKSFIGCGHFSEINRILRENGEREIKWS